MVREVDIDGFLQAADQGKMVDVRSPGEFAQGKIPSAVNVPLFSDEERARVGTCYKQQGRESAVLLGLEIVGPKMRRLAEQLVELTESGTILLHCWRGGMRSNSVAWLATQAGIEPTVLRGGYKAFRSAAHEAFCAERNIVVLSGMTGAGKTTMLHELAAAGEQVLDLEGLANHRGSSFGAIGLAPQPTCEQFENEIFWRLRNLDPRRPVWIEDESPSIGRIRVPDTLWWCMRRAPAIFLDVSREHRARNLEEEYGELDVSGLEEATRRLERKLGGLRMQRVLDLLESGDLYQVAFELLEYYDKSYRHAAERRPRAEVHRLAGEINVERLISFSRERCAA